MKRILLSVILLLAFDFVCGCGHTRVESGSGANKDDVKQVPMICYSYKPNGLQSLEYNAELNDGKVFVSYNALLTEAFYNNSNEPEFKQKSKAGNFSFEYKAVSDLQSSFGRLERISGQAPTYDYVNEFKIVIPGKQIVVRIQNKDDVLSLEPPSLKDASSLLEFHRCILAEIGKELKVDWHCFYGDVL